MVDVALARPVAAADGAPGPTPRPVGARPRAAANGLRVVAIAYVAVLVLLPLGVIVWTTFRPGLSAFFDSLTDPDAVHAFQVSAIVAITALLINVVLGTAIAILLARYRFPGRGLLNALIDLPIAVSPIIVGVALILVYGDDGWFGESLDSTPFQVVYAKPGMVIATVFVSLPILVRAVMPVLEHAGTDQELAAASLGANAVQRFWRITLPSIRTALAYGTVLCFARCLGEYGAVLVVSGGFSGATETAPLRIGTLVDQHNQHDTDSAYAIAFVLVVVALLTIVASAWIRRGREKK